MRLSGTLDSGNWLGFVSSWAPSPQISQGFGLCSCGDELGKCHIKKWRIKNSSVKVPWGKKKNVLFDPSQQIYLKAGIKGDGSFAAAWKHFYLLRECKEKRRKREVEDKLMGFPFQQQVLEGARTGIPGRSSGNDLLLLEMKLKSVTSSGSRNKKGWRPKTAPGGFSLRLHPGAEPKPWPGGFLHFQSKGFGSALVAFLGWIWSTPLLFCPSHQDLVPADSLEPALGWCEHSRSFPHSHLGITCP